MEKYFCSKCGYQLSGSYVSSCPRCGVLLKGVGQGSMEQLSNADRTYREAHKKRLFPRIKLTNKAVGIIFIVLAISFFLLYGFTAHVPVQDLIYFLFFIPVPVILLGVLIIRNIKFWDGVGSFMIYSGVFFSISALLRLSSVDTTEANMEAALRCSLPLTLAGALLLIVRYIRDHRRISSGSKIRDKNAFEKLGLKLTDALRGKGWWIFVVLCSGIGVFGLVTYLNSSDIGGLKTSGGLNSAGVFNIPLAVALIVTARRKLKSGGKKTIPFILISAGIILSIVIFAILEGWIR